MSASGSAEQPGADDEAEGGVSSTDLAPVVGQNLRQLRVRRGLSLERLARASGVSRAMLGQIELGHSVPSINVLWKIARALNVTFSTLISVRPAGGTGIMRRAEAKVLQSRDGKFSSRALFPFDEPRRAEFYELRLASGGCEKAEPHAPGTIENLVVSAGAVTIEAGDKSYRLGQGDAIVFEADVSHSYMNIGKDESVMFLVMTYADAIDAGAR